MELCVALPVQLVHAVRSGTNPYEGAGPSTTRAQRARLYQCQEPSGRGLARRASHRSHTECWHCPGRGPGHAAARVGGAVGREAWPGPELGFPLQPHSGDPPYILQLTVWYRSVV